MLFFSEYFQWKLLNTNYVNYPGYVFVLQQKNELIIMLPVVL